jgi:phosphoglycolate phosphatase
MKLIIFDYDGVLVNSLPFLKRVYLRIADILGIDMPKRDKYFRELLELDWRETYRKLDILAKDKVNISEFVYHNFSHKYRDEIKPYPEIPETLQRLSKKYKLAIVSNSYKKDIIPVLKKYKLDSFFSGIFTPEDGQIKPHPDLIFKCLEHFKVKPEEAAFVGDMDGDIVCGKAAKIGKMIAVTYGFHLKHRLKDADMIIDSPKELLAIL